MSKASKIERKSVGNCDIYSAKASLDIRGKRNGWTTRWVRKGVSFNVIQNGEIIARHGL